MEGRCAKHQFEAAEDTCRACGRDFCAECLVYSFGPKKPPYCIACALTAAGVRTTAANVPTKTKKELKLEARARRKADRESVKNRTANVDVDWSMPEDPTAGLTEEDLRLPTAPVDAAIPPPPPPPPPLAGEDPGDAELPADAVIVPAPRPIEDEAPSRGPFADPQPPLAHDEPPQFLLRGGVAPDLPGSELPEPAPLALTPDAPPPPPPPPSALGLEGLAGPPPAAAPQPPPPPVAGVVVPTPVGPGAAPVPDPDTVDPGLGVHEEPPQFLLRQATPPPRPADDVPLAPAPVAGSDDDLFGVGAVIAPTALTPPPPPPTTTTPAPVPAPPTRATEHLGFDLPGGPTIPTFDSLPAPPPPPSRPPVTPSTTAGAPAPAPPPPPPPPPLVAPDPPATGAEHAAPVIDADHLFAPGTEAPAPGHAPFDGAVVDGAPAADDPLPVIEPVPDPDPGRWDFSGKPLRVRDLLDDPDRPTPLGPRPRPVDRSGFTPGAAPPDEPAFFAPVTPEQFGEDPWPPTT